MVTTNDRRRMLEDAWDAAPETANTLRIQLRTYEKAAGLVVSGGSIASISKNSSSHSYAFGSGNITATEVANVWRELIDLYDGILTAFEAAVIDTSDETIYAEMKARLQPRYEIESDFSLMRCAR